MVTDMISTACLLVVLSQLYKPGLIFLSLLALDIGSHQFQINSAFKAGKSSHKDAKYSTNQLSTTYYGNRMFMAYFCISCEVLYLVMFYPAESETEILVDVLSSNLQKITLFSFLIAASLFGWATKLIMNVIQMKPAADMCVHHDINKKQKY